ncbi:MAG: rsmD [Gammaproteobacteria bacterium]|nr:rsmD [Gammaproteobacteria bacterium]
MVEHNRTLIETLRQQAAALHAEMVEIVQADAIKWLAATDCSFDLVFLDPPFGAGLVNGSLELINSRSILRPGGLVYAEAETGLVLTMADYQIVKQAQAGQVQYMLLEPIKEHKKS